MFTQTRNMLLVVALLAGLSLCMRWQSDPAGRTHDPDVTCAMRLRQLMSAVESYSTSHRGRYPQSLDALAPTYLPILPTCPSWSGSQTYAYKVVGPPSFPDVYTISCPGAHDHPLWTGTFHHAALH